MKKSLTTFALVALLGLSAAAQNVNPPAGYTYGTKQVATSPFTLQELKLLEQSLLFTDEDTKYLKMSHDILKDQTDAILDVWYGFVASTPQLVYFCGNKTTGTPDGAGRSGVLQEHGCWADRDGFAGVDATRVQYRLRRRMGRDEGGLGEHVGGESCERGDFFQYSVGDDPFHRFVRSIL